MIPIFRWPERLPISEKLQGAYIADFDLDEEEDQKLVGGAVANYSGNVVGILGVRKISDQKQYFIIPSRLRSGVCESIYFSRDSEEGSLGVYYLSLSSESAALFGGADRGALVYSPSRQQGLAILSGSAAEKAGLRDHGRDCVCEWGGSEPGKQSGAPCFEI